MEAAELDVQLEELELRLERLRALYEQYFLGIEKLEPAVARKDVDRRIYVLRHEKIRNTGKRFKLQTIIQRYNTFQQYWHRICREIENGTYKRHVLRAERTFGPHELLTIAARKRFGREREREEVVREATPPPEAPAEAVVSPAPPPAPSPPAPPQRAAPPPPPQRGAAPPPPPQRAPLAPPPRAAARPPVQPPATTPPTVSSAAAALRADGPTARPQKFESLDLDMDFLGDWDPASAKQNKAPAKAAKPADPPAAPKPEAAQPAPAPAPAPAPSPPLTTRKPLPRVERKPAAAPAPVPAAAAAPAQALDEARIRALHGKLNELKRQNREAGQVSLEGLAKSLRATEEKLRQQHAGRRIDFDVVVKDGRAIVKPIVR